MSNAGHDFMALYNDDGQGRCTTTCCKHWMTCTISKYCQRGKGRHITVPKVETVIHYECGHITLRCRSYEDRTDHAVHPS
jgi:hypothetical protein